MKGNREQRQMNGTQKWLLPWGYLPIEETLTLVLQGMGLRNRSPEAT